MRLKNVVAKIKGKEILKGINIDFTEGKVHVVMGPNGAGKSTLSKAIVGHYEVEVSGEIIFKGKNIVNLEPEERAKMGIFLSFQNPVEVPGVANSYFLKEAVNAKREYEGKEALNAAEFLKKAKEYLELLGMDREFLNRSLNEGFSGGEKKKNEILQMLMLEPDFIILDEIDSGLDIDALKYVSEGIKRLIDGKRTFLIITHQFKMFDYIKPDTIHILKNGKIVKSGGMEIVEILEKEGYKAIGE